MCRRFREISRWTYPRIRRRFVQEIQINLRPLNDLSRIDKTAQTDGQLLCKFERPQMVIDGAHCPTDKLSLHSSCR